MKKKQIFYLKDDSILTETTEPLLILTLRIGDNVLVMPELAILVQLFYFPN